LQAELDKINLEIAYLERLLLFINISGIESKAQAVAIDLQDMLLSQNKI